MDLIIPTMILVIVFVILGIIANGLWIKMFSFFCAVLVIVFLPMKTDTEVLWEYNFAKFETYGIVEFISPFDGDSISREIKSIEMYNKMSRHEDILMTGYYSLMGFKSMEIFTKDP